MRPVVAMFGEAEKGRFHVPTYLRSLPELLDVYGLAPLGTEGLYFATQILLFEWDLIFVRVKEEGYAKQDYMLGLRYLQEKDKIPSASLHALFLPGVGDPEIIGESERVLSLYRGCFIATEKDLYDYLSAR